MGAPPCMVNEGKNQSQPVKLEWNSMEKHESQHLKFIEMSEKIWETKLNLLA